MKMLLAPAQRSKKGKEERGHPLKGVSREKTPLH